MTTPAERFSMLPRGLQRTLVALGKARADGFDAVTYQWLARELQKSESWAKQTCAALKALGLVVVENSGPGRGKKASAALTDDGKALV